MKILGTAAILALGILTWGAAAANPFPSRPSGVKGVLGSDGVFRAPVSRPPSSEGITVETFNGTVTADVRVTINSVLPAKATITCFLSAGYSVGLLQQRAAQAVTATVSGNRATCKPTVVYKFFTQADTQINFQVEVEAVDSKGNGRKTTPAPLFNDTIPANGTHSSYSASVVL